MQANGAEMPRLACCLATEQGLSVYAPVKDSILIEAEIDAQVGGAAGVHAGGEPGRAGGLELGSDAKGVCLPERYGDQQDEAMWNRVMRLPGAEAGRAEGRKVA